jgi:hypothetical protein
MIVYQMGCARGHHFEGWFASAAACEEQAADGRLQCPACSTSDVRKLPSAPHVRTGEVPAAPAPQDRAAAARREALAQLRGLILANTHDVGRQFAEIARRIHYKEEEARSIRGHVSAEEAEALREEGVETLTLPPDLLPAEEVH